MELRMPVWQWNPEAWTPEFIAGPDLVMRDSMYARFKRQVFFGPSMRKSIAVQGNCVVCDPLTDAQRVTFLVLHAERYGCKIENPGRYAGLVRSIESVEYILCMHSVGVDSTIKCNEQRHLSLGARLRLMAGFPPEFARFV